MKAPFLKGKKYYLRPLLKEDLNEEYLSWLNDPGVNSYSGRRFFPYSFEELKKYYADRKKDSLLLAVVDKGTEKHIGNVLLGPIKWPHQSAEISILIGNRSFWNRGAAREAIYLLSRHAFGTLGLRRLECGSMNPAFINVASKKLGWKKEGILRKKMRAGNSFRDVTLLALLKNEFKRIKRFE